MEPSISASKTCVNATTEFVDVMILLISPTDSPTTQTTVQNMDTKKIHVCYQQLPFFTGDDKDLTAWCRTLWDIKMEGGNKSKKRVENIPQDSQAWRTIDEKFPEIAKIQEILRLRIIALMGLSSNTETGITVFWPVLTKIPERQRLGKIQKQKKETQQKKMGSSIQEKNVAESIVGTLLHVPGKTKDGLNARLDMAELGVKPELFAMQDEDKTTLPLAGYTLTNAKKDIFW
ncbi:hypothetical protein Tco_0213346 [Tanacetum coccineum]